LGTGTVAWRVGLLALVAALLAASPAQTWASALATPTPTPTPGRHWAPEDGGIWDDEGPTPTPTVTATLSPTVTPTLTPTPTATPSPTPGYEANFPSWRGTKLGFHFLHGTGATYQYLRDVRVAAIYEGTNGIQAIDLVGRKVARENGRTARGLVAEMRKLLGKLAAAKDDDLTAIRGALARGCDAFAEATDWIVATHAKDADAVLAGAVPYLKLAGTVAGGWMMAKAALASAGKDDHFHVDKRVTARFYADHMLVQAPALAATVTHGWSAVGRFRK